MKTKRWKRMVVALCCLGSVLGPGAYAENTEVRSVDIALAKGGILIGQVVDTEGQTLEKAEVVLKSGGKEIARCQSDKQGKFQVSGLRGGSIEVATMGTTGNCRVWAPGTAPPDSSVITPASVAVVTCARPGAGTMRTPRMARRMNFGMEAPRVLQLKMST